MDFTGPHQGVSFGELPGSAVAGGGVLDGVGG
jgi:hypothetical protein